MALSPGTRLGHYDVTALIGEGGMGQVWQATDTTLNRQVALKILPDAFADDPDRLARFQREAQVLASLNHPNIAVIYGIEQGDDTQALVLELVEGPTLEDRIKQGPIPLDEALPIAKQIAEALEAAHETGVIHRDLKPANIKVRPDGTVKVLDFGLAKALSGEQSSPDLSQSPTMTATMGGTREGVILGTAAYMSPEQARGKPLDKRTDIWAFGCVLFEMLTGRAAFAGETLSDTIGRVMEREPDWEALPATTVAPLKKVLRRCLSKDQKRRLCDIGDARIEIADVPEGGSKFGSGSSLLDATVPRWRWAFPVVVAAVLVAVTGLGVWGVMNGQSPPQRDVTRFLVTNQNSPQVVSSGLLDLAIAPDGKTVVYASSGRLLNSDAPNRQLHLRSLGDLEARPIDGSTNADSPFVSADGQWVGYYNQANEALMRIPIAGGGPTIVGRSPGIVTGADWTDADAIVFGVSRSGLHRIDASGGEAEPLTFVEGADVVAHRQPNVLPGGRGILFTLQASREQDHQIAVLDVAAGDWRPLARGTTPRYAESGHVVYAFDGDLYAAQFDLDSLSMTGPARPVLSDVLVKDVFGDANFAISPTGTLIYRRAGSDSVDRTFVWVDRDGSEEETGIPPGDYSSGRLAPSGDRLALVTRRSFVLAVWDFSRGTLNRIGVAGGVNVEPLWAPDESRVAFISNHEGAIPNLYLMRADGTGEAESLVRSDYRQQPSSWSSDGRWLVYTEDGALFAIDMLSERIPQPLGIQGARADISPDGRWLAYASDELGRSEVVVRPFPNVDESRQVVSSGGGDSPKWSPAGGELFYRDLEARVMVVEIDEGDSFQQGVPSVLINAPDDATYVGEYSVSPDGSRLLMLRDQQPALNPPNIIMVQNWFEELERLVPTN